MTMSLDDVALGLQHALDRLIRRLRRGDPPVATHRRFLIVQIDGLSRAVLEQALASGHMPFLGHLLTRHRYSLQPMSVGLPTSTPAFQMAAMYGLRPDIPGFHYYDRQQRADVHFPRPGHAARVEARQAAGRRGILQGGSAYGCCFTGGAENDLFSFARLWRPTGRGFIRACSSPVVLGWVLVKCLVRTAVEMIRALFGFIADPFWAAREWQWLTTKIALSVWLRQLFTLAVSHDLYLGTTCVYVNYLDYDVAAHAFGPRSRRALRTLLLVDRSIRQLWRTARRVPEHRYDLYVLADHGQAPSRPYQDLAGSRRFERWVFEELLDPKRPPMVDAGLRSGLLRGIRDARRGQRGLLQHFLNYLDQDFLRGRDREAHEQNGVRVISAGPNAFLYVLDAAAPLDAEALEQRFPGLGEELSRSPGVGFVLARSADGPLCFFRGKRYPLRRSEPGPFAGREDAALVVQGITDLMAMPSAGDLVIYGIDAPGGHVSFIPERGAHAGPSPDEMQTFILWPGSIAPHTPITHPVQLYEHFIRYHEAS
jgi:hypothetical protein